jgi:hypothetical protein
MPAISTLTREEFLEQLSPLSVSACAAVDSETACVICTSEPVDTPVLETEERAVLLHGRHTFGETCASEWIAHNNTYPKCRTVLFQEDGYEFSDYDGREPVFRPDGPRAPSAASEGHWSAQSTYRSVQRRPAGDGLSQAVGAMADGNT